MVFLLFPLADSRYKKCCSFFGHAVLWQALFLSLLVSLILCCLLLDLYEKKKKFIIYGYPLFVAFFLSNFTNLFIKDVVPKMTFPFWPEGGIVFTPFLIIWLFYCLYPCYLLFIGYKKFSGAKRNQIKYVLLGILVGYSTGSTNYFLWYHIPIPPYGNLIVPLFVGLMAYAIVKYRLMDIRIAITRASISLFIYSLVLSIPFWLGYKVLNLTGHWYIPVASGIFLAFLGPLGYSFFRRKTENILLAEQKQYQQILSEASEGMVKIHKLDRLLRAIVLLIMKYVKVSYAVAYLNDTEKNKYILKGKKSIDNEIIPQEYPYEHPFIKHLEQQEMPFTYEEMPEDVKKSLIQTTSDEPARKHSGMGLVVPSVMNKSVIGFLVMGHKENNRSFTDDDIYTFKTISNTAAVAVDNCLFTEKKMKDREVELDVQMKASLGAMADGVAHQFRNVLNIFALMAGTIEMETEDVQELLKTGIEKGVDFTWYVENRKKEAVNAQKVVKRGKDIVEGVISYSHAEKEGVKKDEYKLSDMVDNFINSVKMRHDLDDNEVVPIKTELGNDDLIYCDRQLMFYAIFNAIDNSYEAIDLKRDTYLVGSEKVTYVPEIKLTLVQKEKSSLIKINDNGMGIKEEDKKKVFAPYYTSKESSKPSHSGVGMYFAKRIIEDLHQGRIWFESEYTKGATLYIEIPRKPKV